MSVRSRISALESLSDQRPGQQRPALQTPLSPRVIPSTPPRTSPSPSPPNLGLKSSLIDLEDWVVDDEFTPKVQAPPLPPRRGDSLTVTTRGHSHASSISSFHSVSLSDGSPQTPSFPQEVRKPPDLPARPKSAAAPAAAAPARRPAPPPPPSSDRASIASSTSSKNSAHSIPLTARPTPIPPAARRRYDALFVSLLAAHASAPRPPTLLAAPRRRTAAGWRGLSVDLTSPGADTDDEEPQPQGLPGPVVRVLWSRSRLPRATLSAIWTECDGGRAGVLDREAFARGMWRIDEELRRAETSRLSGVGGRRALR